MCVNWKGREGKRGYWRRGGIVFKNEDTTLPVFVIKVKVHPYSERSSSFHPGYDELCIVYYGLLICMEHASGLLLVVSPLSKDICGKLFIRVVNNFHNIKKKLKYVA